MGSCLPTNRKFIDLEIENDKTYPPTYEDFIIKKKLKQKIMKEYENRINNNRVVL